MKSISLLWNKFRIIYGNYRLYVKFNVTIETKQLSVKKVNPQREFKLKLIKSLSDMGWDTKRISDFLNNNKISFTQKLHPVYKAIQKTSTQNSFKKTSKFI